MGQILYELSFISGSPFISDKLADELVLGGILLLYQGGPFISDNLILGGPILSINMDPLGTNLGNPILL